MTHTVLPILWQKNPVINKIPPTLMPWLFHSESLTKKLRQQCKKFSVRVLKETWQRPRYDEAKFLKISPRESVLVREVQLICDDQVCVFARSIFPRESLRGKGYRLRSLQARPLIEVLAADKLLKRSNFEIACVPVIEHYCELLNNQENTDQFLWQRRSIFYFYNKPILVSELFLPAIIGIQKNKLA